MKNKLSAMAALAAMVLAVGASGAAEMVGWNRQVVQPNSDVLVSLPFTQDAAATLTVSGKTATGVQVAGPLTVDQYKGAYYVRFTTGSAAGQWSTITTNGATDLTLEITDFLTDVQVGDHFSVYPHQTLSTVFPDSLEGVSYKATTGLKRNTEILIPSTTGAAVNRSAAATYYYKNGEWKKVAGSTSDDVVLSPEQYFIIRNNDATDSLTFVTYGKVEPVILSRLVPKNATKNDVGGCTGRPTQVTLAELGLGGSPAFKTTTGLSRQDELFVFDNDAAGKNKSASATYYYKSGHWKKVGQSGDYDNETVPAGAALIIRKVGDAGSSVTWTQYSPY